MTLTLFNYHSACYADADRESCDKANECDCPTSYIHFILFLFLFCLFFQKRWWFLRSCWHCWSRLRRNLWFGYCVIRWQSVVQRRGRRRSGTLTVLISYVHSFTHKVVFKGAYYDCIPTWFFLHSAFITLFKVDISRVYNCNSFICVFLNFISANWH